MADINEILGRNINSVRELKSAISELQNSLIGVDAASEEFKETSQKLTAAQEELNKVTRAGKDDNLAATDSIRGMEKQYKALYDQYKKLSEEQRNSDFGKNMAASLESLSTKLNDTKKDVGNFTNNIGRYAQGATEAFSQMGISLGALQTPMKMATGGAKSLGVALKGLAANPIGAIIMAVVVVLKLLVGIANRVKKAINDNEESSNRLREALSVFRPILDAVSNAFDFLGRVAVKVVEGLTKVAEKVWSIIPGFKKAIQSHKELAKATNELTKAQREASVVNSQKQAEIERLREEASATEDVTEKRKLLEEAKAMQAEVDQKNIELAQEELRIMTEYSKKTANSAAENDKLAAAQKKVNDAVAQGERNMRMYNKQLDATKKSTSGAGRAVDEYKKKAQDLYKQLIDNTKTETQKLTEKYEEEKKLLEKYHFDTKLLTKKYEKEIAEIRLNEWKKEQEEMKKAYDIWRDNTSRWYENLKAYATNNTEEIFIDVDKLMDAGNKIADLQQKTQKLLGEVQDDVAQMFQTIFESADLSKISDYSYIETILAHFYTDEGEANKVMNLFYTFGEEGWASFVEGIEKDVNELNDVFGLNIKNMPDAEAKAIQLGKDISQKIGEGIKSQIDESMRDVNLALIQGDLDSLKYDAGSMETSLAENSFIRLSMERNILEEELVMFEGTQEQKLEILQRYYEVCAEMRENEQRLVELDAERSREIMEGALDFGGAFENALNNIENLMQAEIDSGKLTEKESKRKQKALENLQKVQLAVAIANIAANTAAGIMDVWRSYTGELALNAETAAATGPAAVATKAALDAKSLASAILRTSTIAVQGGAQIAAAVGGYISKTSAAAEEAAGGGIGVVPATIDSTPYTYTRTVQTQEEIDAINRPIYVTVTDIEEGLGQRAQVVNESSF